VTGGNGIRSEYDNVRLPLAHAAAKAADGPGAAVEEARTRPATSRFGEPGVARWRGEPISSQQTAWSAPPLLRSDLDRERVQKQRVAVGGGTGRTARRPE
jgi:hypothetical protein